MPKRRRLVRACFSVTGNTTRRSTWRNLLRRRIPDSDGALDPRPHADFPRRFRARPARPSRGDEPGPASARGKAGARQPSSFRKRNRRRGRDARSDPHPDSLEPRLLLTRALLVRPEIGRRRLPMSGDRQGVSPLRSRPLFARHVPSTAGDKASAQRQFEQALEPILVLSTHSQNWSRSTLPQDVRRSHVIEYRRISRCGRTIPECCC